MFPKAPVILISIDTLRADHLPAYGYKDVETPALDAFAKDAIVFDRAYSHCPMTLPSHVSMLTGLLPTEHGVRNNLGFRFDGKTHRTLPRLLKQHGYATGAAVSSYVLRGETGLREEFDSYDDALDAHAGAAFAEYQRSGDVSASSLQRWIDAKTQQPFFAFLHLYEPHVPYAPPEPFRSRYAAQPYDGEIAAADAIVGRFLDHLKSIGRYDDAMIVITSDHGEGLGDHGEQQHSILLYTEAIRVPLFVKLPKNARGGERVAAPVSLVDLAPTIAGVLGIQAMDAPHATDILAKALPKRSIYSETIYPYVQLGWSDLKSLVDGQWHYIDGPKPELYDVQRDPREKSDVLGENRRVAAAMKKDLEPFPRADAAQASVDPEVARKLASLGYIGTARTRPDPRSLSNPKDVIGSLDRIQEAFALADAGRSAEAAPKLRAIVQQNPRLVDVWVRLGEVERDAGNFDASTAAYRAALDASGVFASDILVSLGDVYLRAGKTAEAEQAARLAEEGSPEKAATLLVNVLLAQKRIGEAEQLARSEVSRRDAAADHMLLASVLRAKGDLSGAMAELDAAGERAKASGLNGVFDLQASRAEIFALSERPAEAIAAYEAELSAFPQNRVAYAKLAVLYFLGGDHQAMDRTLARLVKNNPGEASKALAAKVRATLR